MNEAWYSDGLIIYNVAEIYDESSILQVPNTFLIQPNPGYTISADMFTVEAPTATSIYSSVSFSNQGNVGSPSNTVLGTITYNETYSLPNSNVTETINVIQSEVVDNLIFFNETLIFYITNPITPVGFTIALESNLPQVTITEVDGAANQTWKVSLSANADDIEDIFLNENIFSVTYTATANYVLQKVQGFNGGGFDPLPNFELAFSVENNYPNVNIPSSIINLGTNVKQIKRKYFLNNFTVPEGQSNMGVYILPSPTVYGLSCSIDHENATTSVAGSGVDELAIPLIQGTPGGTIIVPYVSLEGDMLDPGETSNDSQNIYVDASANPGATNRTGIVTIQSPESPYTPLLDAIVISQNPVEYTQLSFSSTSDDYTPPNSTVDSITVPSASQSASGLNSIGFYGFTNDSNVYNPAGDTFVGSSLITLLQSDGVTPFTDTWFVLDTVTVYSAQADLWKTFHAFYLQENTTSSDRIVKIKYEHTDDAATYDILTITQKAAYDVTVDTVDYALSIDGGNTVTALVGVQGQTFAPSGESWFEISDSAQTVKLYMNINDQDYAGLNVFAFDNVNSVTGGWSSITPSGDYGEFVITRDFFGPDVINQYDHPTWYETVSNDFLPTPLNDPQNASYDYYINIDINARSFDEPGFGGFYFQSWDRKIRFRHKHPENSSANSNTWNKIKIKQDSLTELNLFGLQGSELQVSIPYTAGASNFVYMDVFPDQQPVFRYIDSNNEVQADGVWPSWVSSVGSYQATNELESGNRKIQITSTAQANDIVADTFTFGAWPNATATPTINNVSDTITISRNAAPIDDAIYEVTIENVYAMTDINTEYQEISSTVGNSTAFDITSLGNFSNQLFRIGITVYGWTLAEYNDNLIPGMSASFGAATSTDGVNATTLSPINNYINTLSVVKNTDWPGDNNLPTHYVYFNIAQVFELQSCEYIIGFTHGDYIVPNGTNAVISLIASPYGAAQFNVAPSPLIMKDQITQFPQNRIQGFDMLFGDQPLVYYSSFPTLINYGNATYDTTKNLLFRTELISGSTYQVGATDGYNYLSVDIPSYNKFFKFTNNPQDASNYDYVFGQYLGLSADLSANNTSIRQIPDGPGTSVLKLSLLSNANGTPTPSSFTDLSTLATDFKNVYSRSKRYARVFEINRTTLANADSVIPTNYGDSYTIDYNIDSELSEIALQWRLYHAGINNYEAVNSNLLWTASSNSSALQSDSYWLSYGQYNITDEAGGAVQKYPIGVNYLTKNLRIYNESNNTSTRLLSTKTQYGGTDTFTTSNDYVLNGIDWVELASTGGNNTNINSAWSFADGFANNITNAWQYAPIFKVSANTTGQSRSVKLGLYYDYDYQVKNIRLDNFWTLFTSGTQESDYDIATTAGSYGAGSGYVQSGADDIISLQPWYNYDNETVYNTGDINLGSFGEIPGNTLWTSGTDTILLQYSGNQAWDGNSFVKVEADALKAGQCYSIQFSYIQENGSGRGVNVYALSSSETSLSNLEYDDIAATNGYIHKDLNTLVSQNYPYITTVEFTYHNQTDQDRTLAFSISNNLISDSSTKKVHITLKSIKIIRRKIEEVAPDQIINITQES